MKNRLAFGFIVLFAAFLTGCHDGYHSYSYGYQTGYSHSPGYRYHPSHHHDYHHHGHSYHAYDCD